MIVVCRVVAIKLLVSQTNNHQVRAGLLHSLPAPDSLRQDQRIGWDLVRVTLPGLGLGHVLGVVVIVVSWGSFYASWAPGLWVVVSLWSSVTGGKHTKEHRHNLQSGELEILVRRGTSYSEDHGGWCRLCL